MWRSSVPLGHNGWEHKDRGTRTQSFEQAHHPAVHKHYVADAGGIFQALFKFSGEIDLKAKGNTPSHVIMGTAPKHDWESAPFPVKNNFPLNLWFERNLAIECAKSLYDLIHISNGNDLNSSKSFIASSTQILLRAALPWIIRWINTSHFCWPPVLSFPSDKL